ALRQRKRTFGKMNKLPPLQPLVVGPVPNPSVPARECGSIHFRASSMPFRFFSCFSHPPLPVRRKCLDKIGLTQPIYLQRTSIVDSGPCLLTTGRAVRRTGESPYETWPCCRQLWAPTICALA